MLIKVALVVLMAVWCKMATKSIGKSLDPEVFISTSLKPFAKKKLRITLSKTAHEVIRS